MYIMPSPDDLLAVWRLLVVRGGIILGLTIAALPWLATSFVGALIIVATIALVAALFDAAISGALHRRLTSSWILLPEAVLGVLLGGGVLLYPVVPLSAVALLLSLWMLTRGFTLILVARGAPADSLIRTLATGWVGVSLFAPAAMLVHWAETTVFSIIVTLVAYVLIWSAAELTVGLHLRARARQLTNTR